MKVSKRTIILCGILLAVAVIVIWSLALAAKAKKLTELRKFYVGRGFPASYAAALAELKYEHPRWVFQPQPVIDLPWDAIVERECSPGWNLVVYSKWAPNEWGRFGTTNYTPYYAANAKAYDSGAWYQASRETIAYFMDPRNFLNEADVFMFESIGVGKVSLCNGRDARCPSSATDKMSVAPVENTLAGTFMAHAKYDGGKRSFAELLLDVGRRHGVNPIFLAGRLASEQGAGSVQANGTIGDYLVALYTNKSDKVGEAVVWGKNYTRTGARTKEVIKKGAAAYNGYYNFFNIGAYGSGVFEIKYNAYREAVSKEVCRRYCGPWNTQARAIEGGAIRIREKYIDTHRHTRYLQKFSVLAEAGEFRWKQYMQNIAAPLVEARNTKRAYEEADALDAPYRFLIPVYTKMPSKPSRDPADGKSVYSPTR